MNRFCLLATFLCLLAAGGERAESTAAIEQQQRTVLSMTQKLMEMRARLKEGAPELAEFEKVVFAHTKYLEDLRASTLNQLQAQLTEVENELAGLRGDKARADPVREAVWEKARAALLQRLLEARLGFALENETAAAPVPPAAAAAEEAIRAGGISFHLPETVTPAAVDGILRQIAKIAPNVQVAYLIQFRVISATGGDAAQLRRVQGLVDALREAKAVPMLNNIGVEAVRPPRPPAPPVEPRKPGEQF